MQDNNLKDSEKIILTDLAKLRDNYFEASIANADYANNSVTHLQNGLLTIILAELAFIGIVDLSKNNPSLLGVIAAGLLVSSAFLFISAAYFQWRYLLRVSRDFYQLSKDVGEFIKSTKITVIKCLPTFLSDKNSEIKSDSMANKLFILAIISVFVASVLIFVHLLGALK